ncbi:DNA-binding transcriptional LysR family regulator [Bradyrhizobium japonicum]|jgi:DNA-binding transcriptional LysR family regulator|uniref:DNA-binding transcriptional LysR family regulator n=1 Tax=Bradyrhizobium elkanii TaxID=29448 RepID=A0ABV4FDM0_BRAEL|nr:LysR family transcriptional regulator [Bradyrhizobium elkanii]MBP2431857.1 DNA-binding transcriptional LysR family regulator [Bradyrhizobium elkanii]MCP1735071.1 DNA-binding transcriptional LysR family regulator [Bradyrhizobium elkanii]MCP1752614.1 DNA-binding transcriptional LysR family regulator [Bradyrhizobium elkanii]MCP1978387.1 DNA-binding transcriptional LysR family regulator [Bradyrhizobium elkanii]MCS3570410.1 DNA-binding transcriptional LysR family regulator [Bradyrhizobium elkani
MDNRVGEMQVFLRVAEAGSYSEAARRLLMTPSTVSKLIGRIEARLGVRLFERSTRRLSLTSEGRTYQDKSVALLAELDSIERDISRGAATAGGTVRVNTTVAFGVLGLEPLLPAFWKAHPAIVVDISLSDEIVDMYLDRTDVAFRVGPLQASAMVARRIGVIKRRIVASPDYIDRLGKPETVDDLSRHNCLGFNFRRSAPVWPLKESGRIVDRAISGSLLANNAQSLRRMAIAGIGLARLADYHVRDDISAGRLVEVLEGTAGDEEQIHALYHGGPRLPFRVRAFLEFMCPRLTDFMEGRIHDDRQSVQASGGRIVASSARRSSRKAGS